ncbi:putative carbonic anhydrase 3 [Schistocerca gregaria]|uniref:putative carbonic anhydrase 3 n=1 Tax=Schistocerca gregaria TaxID=7010 RepID=UPI00211E2276|nr:putative carbonic anhydrase 3 [Schistocerca gregaria]
MCRCPVVPHSAGPHTWPSGAAGRRQSPVNVRSEFVQQVDGCPPLLWPGYDVLPCKLSLSNDGTAAVLRGCWGGRGCAPALSGGPLGEGCWPFAWAEFHWGPSDDEGSEHTLDYCRYALELQVVHGPCEGAQYEYVCVAVLFEAVMEDNPYLDPVVQALHQVRRPGCCTQLMPFPLDWLSPPMEQSYLSYSGSLTRPPCSEGVLWILRPHPLTISSRQLDFSLLVRQSELADETQLHPPTPSTVYSSAHKLYSEHLALSTG